MKGDEQQNHLGQAYYKWVNDHEKTPTWLRSITPEQKSVPILQESKTVTNSHLLLPIVEKIQTLFFFSIFNQNSREKQKLHNTKE